MIQTFFTHLVRALLLLVLQVFILNHIHVGGLATPQCLVYFMLVFPLGASRHAALLWCFVIGVVADFFALTPGLSAASLTLVGLVQPYLFARMAGKDHPEGTVASFRVLGTGLYVRYAALLIFLHHAVYYGLEFLSFRHPLYLLMSVCGSALLTLPLCLAFERLREAKS